MNTDKPWEVQRRELDAERDKAVGEVQHKRGLEGVIGLARQSEDAISVGSAVARGSGEMHLSAILPSLLDHEENKICEMARGYLGQLTKTHSEEWLRSIIKPTWNVEQSSVAALWLPFSVATWDYLIELNSETAAAYWKRVRPPHELPTPADCERTIEELLNAGRVPSAIDFLKFVAFKHREEFAPSRVLSLLQQILNSDSKETPSQLDTHHLGELVGFLQKSNVDTMELAKLEWSLSPLLSVFSPVHPVTLHRQLSKDPIFFVSLLELVFKPAGELSSERPPLDEVAKRKAEYAWHILDRWKGIPGIQDDGNIDIEKLREWIRIAREHAKEKDRTKICDIQIGEMLAYSPPNAEKTWPSSVICQILEEFDNEEVERGIFFEKRNTRGIVSKHPSEGGEQERNLAKQFRDWADVLQSEWLAAPRLLRRLAESYDFEAKREDERVDD